MRIFKHLLIVAFMVQTVSISNAQSVGDILSGIGGKSSAGDILGSVIEGVFTKSDLSLSDLVGEYTSEGPAVTFKSENLLQKAGGLAGAAKLESELKPYYEKYGLTGMALTVDESANFKMKVKLVNLNGTITKNDSEGTFDFNFKVAGINIGKFTAYIQKSGSTLKVMFDATKLKDFISTIAKFTGNSMAKALGTILDSYEGACVGFRMVATSSVSDSSSSNSTTRGLDNLKEILTKGK